MDRRSLYSEAIERRRALSFDGYVTLTDVGFDGPWVSPIQKFSNNLEGPMLIAKDWFDVPSIIVNSALLHELCCFPTANFNKVLDLALIFAGLSRSQIYLTQAFHLLPEVRSANIFQSLIDWSFNEVTRHEIMGRLPIALGNQARDSCRKFDIPHIHMPPPSRGSGTFAQRAERLAEAIDDAMRKS